MNANNRLYGLSENFGHINHWPKQYYQCRNYDSYRDAHNHLDRGDGYGIPSEHALFSEIATTYNEIDIISGDGTCNGMNSLYNI